LLSVDCRLECLVRDAPPSAIDNQQSTVGYR
jgi:hypothetical protein